MCKTLVVVTEAAWSRTVTIAATLFLLVLMPVGAQPPPSLHTLPGRNARIFNKKPTPTPAVTPTPTNEPQFKATLEVSPSPPVNVNQEVTFTVVPGLPGAVEYRFNFGDDQTSGWIAQPRTTHRYFETNTYRAYAEIRGRARALAQGTKNTPPREVLVVRRSNPTPSATVPARITPSPTAAATATVPISPSPSSPTATATAGFTTAPPLQTTPSPASPTATPSPPTHHTARPTATAWNGGSSSHTGWSTFYIISAGLAGMALIGILIKPTFHLRADWDTPQRPPENLAINYGLYFHSNVSAGESRLQTDGASLILRRRTQ